MTTEQFISSLTLVPLRDLLAIEERKLLDILETFKCEKNKDLEEFITNPSQALRFEKNQTTRTYLFLDENINLIAYFTIALKVLDTSRIFSKSLVKKLDGIDKNRQTIPCYLIAQLGKHSNCEHKIGQFLLDYAIETIKKSVEITGGRFILLDSVNEKKVIDFYTSYENGFTILIDPKQEDKNITLFYPLY